MLLYCHAGAAARGWRARRVRCGCHAAGGGPLRIHSTSRSHSFSLAERRRRRRFLLHVGLARLTPVCTLSPRPRRAAPRRVGGRLLRSAQWLPVIPLVFAVPNYYLPPPPHPSLPFPSLPFFIFAPPAPLPPCPSGSRCADCARRRSRCFLASLDPALIAASRPTLGDHVGGVTVVFEDVLLHEKRTASAGRPKRAQAQGRRTAGGLDLEVGGGELMDQALATLDRAVGLDELDPSQPLLEARVLACLLFEYSLIFFAPTLAICAASPAKVFPLLSPSDLG
jgi:hypothetical protein